MIRGRNLLPPYGTPHPGWGMCTVLSGGGNLTGLQTTSALFAAFYCPFDFLVRGAFYSVGTLTTATSVAFSWQLSKATAGGGGFSGVAALSSNGIVAAGGALIDVSQNPIERLYAAATPWVVGRIVVSGGTAADPSCATFGLLIQAR